MNEGISPKIQAVLRVRADVCGAIAGVLGLVAWKCLAVPSISQTSAVQLAGTNMTLALIAGILATLSLPWSELGAKHALALSAHTGIRSGFIASLVSAGLILAASVIGISGAITRADDMQLRVLAWHSLLVLLAALLPSVPAGLAGGLIGLTLRMPEVTRHFLTTLCRSKAVRIVDDEDENRQCSWLGRSLVALSVLGMLSPLTLIFRALKVDPPPPVVSQPSPPPPFHYIRPSNFDSAGPGQFVITARKNIPTVASDKPMLFANDSRLFAYCPANANRVVVLNLDTLKEIASFVLPRVPNHLAWSPDMTRIFYLVQDNESRMGILSLPTRSSTELPRPKNRDVPTGPLAWGLSNMVVFYPSDEPRLCLDLDTLLLVPLDESSAFKASDEAMRTKLKNAPHLAFPKREGWQMILDASMQSVQPPPRREPSKSWNVGGFATLGFKGTHQRVVQWVPQIVLQPGQVVIPSPDGSKLIHHSDNHTEVIYFGIRENVPPVVSIKMPLAREKKKEDAALTALIKQHDLCAFAYAPIINPLNGKTVGPDREHVRSLLRILQWDDEAADFWVAEQFGDLKTGDVVADLHTWVDGQIKPISSLAKAEWWAEPTIQAHADRAVIPSAENARDLEKLLSIQTMQDTYTIRFEKIARMAVQRQETKPVPATQPSPKPGARTEADVQAFIRQHHAKAAARDLEGLMADYADEIEQQDDKILTRAQLRENEAADFKKWPRGTEVVESFKLVNVSDDVWSAIYVVRFSEENGNGEVRQGFMDMTMFGNNLPEGLKITVQETLVRDVQTSTPTSKQKGPPPVAVTVPKLCWVGTMKLVDAPNIEVTSQIHFHLGAATLHRTFRLLDQNGQVLKWCRAEYEGEVTQQNATLEVYLSKQGWGQGGDREFVRQMAPMAARLVGQHAPFDLTNAGDLVERSSGQVLKLTK